MKPVKARERTTSAMSGLGKGHVGRKAMLALLLLQLTVAALAVAQDRIRDLFPSQPSGYLNDIAGVVDAASARSIADKIQRLRDATGAEIAVVTLPTIGDYAPSDVALEIGRAWGVGAKADVGDARKNAGVVVLLVPKTGGQPGRLFIATGRGVEGFVTDAIAGRVRDLMTPQLAGGEYGPGLRAGVDALAGIIARGFGVTDTMLTGGDRAIYRDSPAPKIPRGLIFAIIIIAIVVISNMSSRGGPPGDGPGRRGRRRRGPNIFWGPGWGGGFGGGGGFSGGGAGGDF